MQQLLVLVLFWLLVLQDALAIINNNKSSNKAQNAFVIIEETAAGRYQIKDEFPAEETRIVLKQLDGTERVLTKLKWMHLVAEEAAKIDNGTSNLTQAQNPQMSQQGGMGLGEVLLIKYGRCSDRLLDRV